MSKQEAKKQWVTADVFALTQRTMSWPTQAYFIFCMLWAFRILIITGVILRLASHWDQAGRRPLWLETQTTVFGGAALYLIACLIGFQPKFASLDEKEQLRGDSRRALWFTVFCDWIYITIMYAVTMEPESDFYLFYFIPLITGLVFLPRKDVMRVLALLVMGLISALILITFRWPHHIPEPPRQLTISHVIINIFTLRALTLGCACIPLFENKMQLIGQIHTHPTDAYHSETDDAYPIATTVGSVSLVIPNFARQPFSLSRCAIYRLLFQRGWVELTPREASTLIQIVEQ